MKYCYSGFLSEHTASSVKSFGKKYLHVLEITRLPYDWSEWHEQNLVDHHIRDRDTDADRITKMYGTVRNNEESLFLFLSSKNEKDLFVKAFPNLIINENPFTTIID